MMNSYTCKECETLHWFDDTKEMPECWVCVRNDADEKRKIKTTNSHTEIEFRNEITNTLLLSEWLDAQFVIETKHGLIQVYVCPDRDVFVLYDTDERYMGEVTYEYICGMYDIATIEEAWIVWLKDVEEGETSVRFLFESLFGFKYVRLVPLKDCNVIGEYCFIRE